LIVPCWAGCEARDVYRAIRATIRASGLNVERGDAPTDAPPKGTLAWAAGSASFMPALAATVPDYIEAVTIFANPDKTGRDGAHKLATGLRSPPLPDQRCEGLMG
jgi:hypothetical protein